MKHLISAAALVAALLAPATVAAETLQERCSNVASVAHSIMLAHQNGVALGVTLASINETFSDPEIGIAYTELALIAYGEPRYHSEGAQQRSAAEFRDGVHVWCLS
jgi:hypothetical protein